MILPLSINDVIVHLDGIIAECIRKKSRAGYFACLYRKMTIAVQQGIENGMFENGKRMELFDVHFANRYLFAYRQYESRQACTSAWCHAFDAGEKEYTVLQHLLLGMNAHINLDLGIAAAEISAGSDIQALRPDFEKINNIIGSLVNTVQTDLEDICFPMHFVRYIDNSSKDAVINFSIALARKTAWANALALSALPAENHPAYISTLDVQIAQVARNIINPDFSQGLLLKSIRLFEPKDTGKIISCLKD
jgi:hypothetical protein